MMGSKKSRKVISLEMKQEIIRRSECGVKQCDLWKAVQEFTNAHYPDSAEANRINDLYSDTLVRYFRQMLKKREKQTTLDRFFTAPSAKKRKMDEDVQDSIIS